MAILISASGRPAKPVLYFLSQFGVTLVALPAYYFAAGLLKRDALAFVVAIGFCFLAVSALRRFLLPQHFTLTKESDGAVRFSGRFEGDGIPYLEPKGLVKALIEKERLILQSDEAQKRYCLTPGQFQPGTMAALESLISRVSSGVTPEPIGFPDSVRLLRHEHRGNVIFHVRERPSGLLLYGLAFALGICCLLIYIAWFH